jgi:hypothetical protein
MASLRKKRQPSWKKQISNLLKIMSKIFYDIIPPKADKTRVKRKKLKKLEPSFVAMINALERIVAFGLIVSLNWTGLSAVIQTNTFLSDIESSEGNVYTAGALDFILSSPSDFLPVALALGESATRTIELLNTANIPQYNITVSSFAGDLCQYLNAEVSLDGGGVYSGSLEGFAYGPIIFEAPDVWSFTLTLPADAPENAQGQTCQYNSVFFGSQIRNNLPFGTGFNDVEEIGSNIASKLCLDSETRSMGYWAHHHSVYLQYLPQFLGATGTDEIIDTPQKAYQVFLDYNLSMRNKLKGQLLVMKFNVAHFGVGDYFVASVGRTINQIIASADDLLRQDPEPSHSILEAQKDLLESLVDLQIHTCSTTHPPEVLPNIVINEFLPNPLGTDSMHKPHGEWVELYNNTGADVNVAGWWLYDDQDSNELAITNSNTNTGNTIIPNGGFLVVYRNGDLDFALNNTGGDSVRLYDGPISTGNLIDSHTYSIDAPEGKSFARIPDGSSNWVDPVPTPGGENILEGEDVIFGEAISEPDENIEDGDPQENTTAAENQGGGIIETISNAIEEVIYDIVEEIIPDSANNVSEETAEIAETAEITEIVETAEIIESAEITETLEAPIIEEVPVVEQAPMVAVEQAPVIEEEPLIVPENTTIEGAAPEAGGDGTTGDGAMPVDPVEPPAGE